MQVLVRIDSNAVSMPVFTLFSTYIANNVSDYLVIDRFILWVVYTFV